MYVAGFYDVHVHYGTRKTPPVVIKAGGQRCEWDEIVSIAFTSDEKLVVLTKRLGLFVYNVLHDGGPIIETVIYGVIVEQGEEVGLEFEEDLSMPPAWNEWTLFGCGAGHAAGGGSSVSRLGRHKPSDEEKMMATVHADVRAFHIECTARGWVLVTSVGIFVKSDDDVRGTLRLLLERMGWGRTIGEGARRCQGRE